VTKTGILLHVYHLDTGGWEKMIWGDAAHEELGTGTKFIECLLNISPGEQVTSIVYSGPSRKDGLTEGAYTQKYLQDRVGELLKFPRLRHKLDALSSTEYAVFLERLYGLALGPAIKNTEAEIDNAAAYFFKKQVDRVIQVAAATHAPRCLRNQLAARQKGLIDKRQRWFVTASDVGYHGVQPDDVVIAEPIHRQDNPLYGFRPAWSELAKRYPRLSLENKKMLLRRLDEIMTEALASQPETTEVAN